MTTIGIIGSTKYPKMRLVMRYVSELSKDTKVNIFISRGVARCAYNAAAFRGLRPNSFSTNWDKYGASAKYISDVELVTASDEIVAFWDGQSKGTVETINVARAYGKPIKIFGPDGNVLE